MIIRHYNVNNNEQQKQTILYFLSVLHNSLNYNSRLPDYHLPSAFHLNCAAHMGNVDDFKVTDFSG